MFSLLVERSAEIACPFASYAEQGAGMHLALLFNSDHPAYRSNYDRATVRCVLRTGIIQNSYRHMKLGSGDVLIPNGTRSQRDAMREAIYFEHGWGLRHAERLRAVQAARQPYAPFLPEMQRFLKDMLKRSPSTDSGAEAEQED